MILILPIIYREHENYLYVNDEFFYSRIFHFIFGILTYRIHKHIKISPNIAKNLLYIVAICYAYYWYEITSYTKLGYLDQLNKVLFGIILILDIESKHDNLLAKLLSFRPITFLGDISFSLYLVQFRVIEHINRLSLMFLKQKHIAKIMGYPLTVIVVAFISIFISYFTEKYIEQHFASLGSKVEPYILKFKRAFKYLILSCCIAYCFIV